MIGRKLLNVGILREVKSIRISPCEIYLLLAQHQLHYNIIHIAYHVLWSLYRTRCSIFLETLAEMLLHVVLALCTGSSWKAPLVPAGRAFESHTWQKGER